jgi:hypothetical protein
MSDESELGSDWAALDDLDPYGQIVAGKACVAQGLVHRFSTPRGGLFYDLSYGKDLRAYLEESLTPERLAAIPGEVSDEAKKDERVQSATTTVSYNDKTEKLTITLVIITAEGPFTLVLEVSKLTVELLRLE